MTGFPTYTYDEKGIQERVDRILSIEIPEKLRLQALKLILGSIDLTTLEATDTEKKVTDLCRQAASFSSRNKQAPNVAAVCVYPHFAALVRKELENTGIRTACVAAGFPSGQTSLPIKLMEVSSVVIEGAQEVDMVISRGKFLEGRIEDVGDEIRAIKAACGEAHLKVILETGELISVENIRKASEIALLAGADFLKTSTGKIKPAATPGAFLVMLDTIRDFHAISGRKVGIKAAGGIADADAALQYYLLVREVLGNDWLNKDLFRIGASRLAEKVFSELQ
jgi:deoxyribose-phosphate aldolase